MFTALEDNSVWLCPIDNWKFNNWKYLNKIPILQSFDNLNQTSCQRGGIESGQIGWDSSGFEIYWRSKVLDSWV